MGKLRLRMPIPRPLDHPVQLSPHPSTSNLVGPKQTSSFLPGPTVAFCCPPPFPCPLIVGALETHRTSQRLRGPSPGPGHHPHSPGMHVGASWPCPLRLPVGALPNVNEILPLLSALACPWPRGWVLWPRAHPPAPCAPATQSRPRSGVALAILRQAALPQTCRSQQGPPTPLPQLCPLCSPLTPPWLFPCLVSASRPWTCVSCKPHQDELVVCIYVF